MAEKDEAIEEQKVQHKEKNRKLKDAVKQLKVQFKQEIRYRDEIVASREETIATLQARIADLEWFFPKQKLQQQTRGASSSSRCDVNNVITDLTFQVQFLKGETKKCENYRKKYREMKDVSGKQEETLGKITDVLGHERTLNLLDDNGSVGVSFDEMRRLPTRGSFRPIGPRGSFQRPRRVPSHQSDMASDDSVPSFLTFATGTDANSFNTFRGSFARSSHESIGEA